MFEGADFEIVGILSVWKLVSLKNSESLKSGVETPSFRRAIHPGAPGEAEASDVETPMRELAGAVDLQSALDVVKFEK